MNLRRLNNECEDGDEVALASLLRHLPMVFSRYKYAMGVKPQVT